jgi:hypothetical protein
LASAVEGAAAVSNGYLQSLSWQQFISCDDDNLGCGGGSLVYAMVYAAMNDFGGITTNKEYPYTDGRGATTDTCGVSGKKPAVEITGASYVVDFYDDFSFAERMSRMKRALEKQPVAIVIRSNCQTISVRSLLYELFCFTFFTKTLLIHIFVLAFSKELSIRDLN